jgi:hypothetical protein
VRQAGGVPARPVRRPRVARAPLTAALATAVAALLAGCGATPPTIGTRGIDGLTVPTPNPDPADFVAAVDHPVLPLLPDARWELADPVDGDRVAVEVAEEQRTVAGVITTGLVLVPDPAAAGQGASAPTTAWVAEDQEGNVWLFAGSGPDGAWAAGEDGAAAGLLLAADPRVGDGYALWSVDGEPQAAAEVRSTDEELAVPWGLAEGVVTLALDLDLLREGPELRVALADDVGPVAAADLVADEELVLVARS